MVSPSLDRDPFRARLLSYTRRAFSLLPNLDHPEVLDLGCGSGVPTLDLVRLTNGRITAVDIDRSLLDRLDERAASAGVSHRVRTVQSSLKELDLPGESFDLIWSEGAIYAIGFENGLRYWRRFLTAGGFLVVHDALGDRDEKVRLVDRCGFRLLGSCGAAAGMIRSWHGKSKYTGMILIPPSSSS